MITQSFKNTERTSRIQLTEENYGAGMRYTDTPLMEGFCAELVNFDIKDAGAMLAPRPGLRTQELAAFMPVANNVPIRTADGPFEIITGKTQAVLGDGDYKELIMLSMNPDDLDKETYKNTELISGTLRVCTVQPTGKAVAHKNQVIKGIAPEIPTSFMTVSPTSESGFFKQPKQASIHGLKIDDTSNMLRHVGTYAFNNDYYFLRALSGTQLMRTKFEDGKYDVEVINPRQVTPKEAVTSGFNMLLQRPFTDFKNTTSGTVNIQGCLPYDEDGKLCVQPRLNQTVKLICTYSAAANQTYKVKWECKTPVETAWHTLKAEYNINTGTNPPEVSCTVSGYDTDLFVRVTMTHSTNPAEFQILTATVYFGKTVQEVAEVQTYSLTKCSGMTYWKNRLVVYGAPEDKTILFMSDVNNPEYFPYPNNIDIFEEPIVYAVPCLDSLIVFTTSKVYNLTLTPDGMSWTKKCIQANLDIKEWDLHLIQVVKNMVLFKSGNYYYMIVPNIKVQTVGELIIAPISKNIETLLDNFSEAIDNIVQKVYDYKRGLKLIHYYNFLDYEDIHNTYVFQTVDGLYINVVLLYNTVARNWRIYTYESQHILKPFTQSATSKGVLMGVVNVQQRYDIHDTSGTNHTLYTNLIPCVQFLSFNDKSQVADMYIPDGTLYDPPFEYSNLSNKGTPANLELLFNSLHKYKNFQLLDTGNRDHSVDLKKRYRELQLKINNTSQRKLKFYTEFFVDGDPRRAMNKYTFKHDTDPASPNYQILTLERDLERLPYSEIPGTTILAETDQDLDCWVLDESIFPGLQLWKIRIPVSGKGYMSRMVLVSFNEHPFELLSNTWVFRQLNSR